MRGHHTHKRIQAPKRAKKFARAVLPNSVASTPFAGRRRKSGVCRVAVRARSNSLLRVDDITQILQTADAADPKVAEKLLPLVYDELRRLAAAKMANERPGQTLQATALVHEAYLRLVGNGAHSWQNRRHFFGAAAEAMRHILVDRARRKAAVRHGGEMTRLNLDEVLVAAEATDENVVRVNDALEKLAARDREAAELVKLRFFAGFTSAEAAELLGLSERTAKRTWAYARAWLFKELTRAS